jgi:hypothetical protein
MLVTAISGEDQQQWSHGTPADWAMETFGLARDHAYGPLPAPSGRGIYLLDDRYVRAADSDVRLQLGKAGIRLAVLLNKALAPP